MACRALALIDEAQLVQGLQGGADVLPRHLAGPGGDPLLELAQHLQCSVAEQDVLRHALRAAEGDQPEYGEARALGAISCAA
ncbi:hypothetical protein [Streptomyces sp. NPDC001948]